MFRLKNRKQVIYDANIIVYFMFPRGEYRIPVFTEYAKVLTEFLFSLNTSIVVPHFIINEIERKGYYKFIEDYFKDIRKASKYQLMKKLRNNFENLKKHEYFLEEYYEPSEKLLNSIDEAFNNFNNLENIDEYFLKKHTDSVNPSLEDKKLILFSKDKQCPLISNDLDLTFFSEELVNLNLVHEIIDFKSIDFNC